jgi:hypothetical protein
MKPIRAMLIASEIIRALVSMPDAIPARVLGTAAVVVFVTGVLVRPRPAPATRQPGNIVNQLEFVQTVSAQLTWSHNTKVLDSVRIRMSAGSILSRPSSTVGA